MRGSVALPLALSTALLVPAVHWCPIPWEQTSIECVATCSVTKSGQCRDVAVRREAISASEEPDAACPVAGSSREDSCTPCPLPSAFPEKAPGRAYILGDEPGGLLIRGHLLPDFSQLAAPQPPRTDLEPTPRPSARPPEPDVRPPTFAWTSVRLARAPPGA